MFSALLIGPPGAGKTTASSTAPGPVLYLDVDNKLHKMENLKSKLTSGHIIQWAVDEPLTTMSLTSLAVSDPKPGQKMVTPRPKGYMQLATMIDKLVACKCVVDGKKIGTVVLDSYTSTEEHIKRLLMSVNGTNTMTLALYGTLLTNFETLNNTLLRLPCNVIFLAHEKTDKDELTQVVSFHPLISGGMSSKIGKDFEEVYYLEKKITSGVAKYEMLTVGSSMKACRTSRILAPRVEPDFSKIYG